MYHIFMDERKQKLLSHIIEAYIEGAEPIGSGLISSEYMKDVSSPTIRNEMQELERLGYICQPHTSAGRIPTEKGYRYYLGNTLPAKELPAKKQAQIERILLGYSGDERVKQAAKAIAELSESAVVVGFAPHDVYYTGLSNLFAKPEFASQSIVVELSQIIDRLDEVMAQIHSELDDEISVLLGSDNPFGRECGSVLTRARIGRRQTAIGILGPQRMDYAQNIAFIRYVKGLLES